MLKIGFDGRQCIRVLLLPQQRLTPLNPSLLNRARILDRLEHTEPVHARFRIIGEHGGEPHAILLLVRICGAELAELGDRRFPAAGAGRFGFVERFGPPARGRLLVAENLAIDVHGFVRLVLHRESPCLVEPIPLFGRWGSRGLILRKRSR